MYPPLILTTDQQRDTIYHLSLHKGLQLRLLSLRSYEARSQNLLNQDYICFQSDPATSSLAFCVCDGVGGSYRGDFAARYLAHQIVDYLHSQAKNLLAIRDISFARDLFAETIHNWATTAHLYAQSLAIAPDTPSIVREALEELRDQHGSATVFCACYLHCQDSKNPIELLCATLGNVQATITNTTQQILGSSNDDNHGYWSTAKGNNGTVLLIKEELTSLSQRLTVTTDGMRSHLIPDEILHDEQIDILYQQEFNDDATILELTWSAEAIDQPVD